MTVHNKKAPPKLQMSEHSFFCVYIYNIHILSMLASRIYYFNVCLIVEEMERRLLSLLAAIPLKGQFMQYAVTESP